MMVELRRLLRAGLIVGSGWLSAALVFAAVAGCQLLMEKLWSPKALSSFSHAAHQSHAAGGCGGCHRRSADRLLPAFPARDKCESCHQGSADAEMLARFFAPEQSEGRSVRAGRQSGEIIFDHHAHTRVRGLSCLDCHRDVASASTITSSMKIEMDECIGCHEERAPQVLECEHCHRVLSRSTQPESHRESWIVRHGPRWRSVAGGKPADQCSLCHTQGSCDDCHTQTRPRSHNNFWRGRGHGVAAGIDRDRCRTCHQRDVCDICHQQTRPRSHTPSFGEPTLRHCYQCHLPINLNESCGVCHLATPAHETGPAMPSDAIHATSTGSHCRTAHAPLPHPDNGEDCRFCHR